MNSVQEKTIELLKNCVIEGNADQAKKAAEDVLRTGSDPMIAFRDGLISAMSIVGEKMATGEMFVTQVMLSADAMKSAMEVLKPRIADRGFREIMRGTIVIGSAQGDIHDIGKNIVATMLEASGFEIHDMGTDVPATKFVDQAEAVKADIIASSALLSTTQTYQQELIEELKNRKVRNLYKVMVGGGIVTKEWADAIGADGYGKDAAEAVKIATMLVKDRQALGAPSVQ